MIVKLVTTFLLAQEQHYGGVIVEDNTFIGAESCILPRIKIKSNVLVAAKALVNRNLEKYKSKRNTSKKI